MVTEPFFPHAGFLHRLELDQASAAEPGDARLALSSAAVPAQAVVPLIALLRARRAVLQAESANLRVAGELRRYQKFVRPGSPSPHIVQLRQQQGAARRAASQSRQAFIRAAAVFVRDAAIDVPARTGLELFITRWIEASVPTDPGLRVERFARTTAVGFARGESACGWQARRHATPPVTY